MDWTFVYLMVVLKLPIVGLFMIIWWAVKAEPAVEPDADEQSEGGTGGGGSKVPREPFGPRPRTRGPHGDPSAPPRPRTRPVTARGRTAGGNERGPLRGRPRSPSH